MAREDFFVSVIIPTYNGERTLAACIESVLSQRYESLEIVVVDDGSTDGTHSVVKLFGNKVRYIYQDNRGPSAARNRGIELSKGVIIGLLDDDDLWIDRTLSLQIRCMRKDPSIEIVCGLTQYRWLKDDKIDSEILRQASEPVLSFNFGSAIYRRSVFDKVGFFDETKRTCEDVDWFLRAREKGVNMAVLEAATLLYHKHPEGISHGKDIHESNFLKEIKASLDRRRADRDKIAKPLSELPRIKISDLEEA